MDAMQWGMAIGQGLNTVGALAHPDALAHMAGDAHAQEVVAEQLSALVNALHEMSRGNTIDPIMARWPAAVPQVEELRALVAQRGLDDPALIRGKALATLEAFGLPLPPELGGPGPTE